MGSHVTLGTSFPGAEFAIGGLLCNASPARELAKAGLDLTLQEHVAPCSTARFPFPLNEMPRMALSIHPMSRLAPGNPD